MTAGTTEAVAPTAAVRWGRLAILGAWTVIAAAAAALLPRLAQDPAYHAFADQRPLGPLPNAAAVLSNLAFVAAGIAGLLAVRPGLARFADPRERRAWVAFFGSVALVGPGSAWYHLAPSNGSLFWDRLPMATAFAALLVAVLAERLGPAATRWLAPLLAASAGTVLYWWVTEGRGIGDLRPYAFAQYYPMAALPLAIALFPERYDGGAAWIAGLGLYGLAKAAELSDGALLRATGLLSGHTLKHLLAAAAVLVFAVMVRRRTPLAAADQRG
jgi:hypothetical protein